MSAPKQGQARGAPRTGGGSTRTVALTLKGWRWATSQGYRIPCELHGVARCSTCMDPARVGTRERKP